MKTYDSLLEAYLASVEAAKAADEAKEELRLQVMALAGSETSSKYIVKVSESTSERLEGLKAIADKSPSLLAALHSAGCVKTVTSTRLTVKPLT